MGGKVPTNVGTCMHKSDHTKWPRPFGGHAPLVAMPFKWARLLGGYLFMKKKKKRKEKK